MKLRVVEVNITEEKGYIEACQIPIFKRAKSITVKIEREGNSGNVYIVKLELSKKIGLSEGSKFINNFTHYLITKHKSKEENASK